MHADAWTRLERDPMSVIIENVFLCSTPEAGAQNRRQSLSGEDLLGRSLS